MVNIEDIRALGQCINKRVESALKGELRGRKDSGNNNDGEDGLVLHIEKIVSICEELIPHAESFCFKGQHANGVYSVLKIVKKFFELILFHEMTSEKYTDFLLMSRTIHFCVTETLVVSKHSQNLRSSFMDLLPQATRIEALGSSVSLAIKQTERIYNDPSFLEGHKVINAKYPMFWCESVTQRAASTFTYLLALLATSPLDLVHFFRNMDFYGSVTQNLLLYANSWFPTTLLRVFTVHSPPLISAFHFSNYVSHKTVHIVSENQFVVSTKTFQLERVSNRKSKPIRCRYLRPASWFGDEILQETLMIQCHGGGYVTGSPDGDELVILTDVCTKLDRCPILALDYELMEAFPASLQDAIDVYVWLMQEEENVEQQLGFVPKRIIFCGESAGAHILFGLTLVIRDIIANFNMNLTMPSSLIFGSGFLNPSLSTLPSRILSTLDFLVSPSVGILVHTVLAGNCEGLNGASKEERSNIRKVLGMIKGIFRSGVEKPWYLASAENMEAAHRECSRILSSRYASPMLTEDIRQINVPLYLLCPEFCPNLDDAIALASIWKGDVTLDVLPDVPHAYIGFAKVSTAAKHGYKLLLDRLKEVLALK